MDSPMKKVNVLIILAGLFISGVMIFLLMSGVKARQKKMVKWSAVETPEQAGQKIGRFFYPILKEHKSLIIEEGSLFSQKFSQGFVAEAAIISPNTDVVFGADGSGDDHFFLMVRKPDKENCVKQCSNGQYEACVCVGSIKKFSKKNRDPSKYWINIIQLKQNKAILFYVEPSLAKEIN